MSKVKSVLGKDLMLFVEAKALALATSCKLGLSAETIDTQSKDSGIWTEKDIKKLSWNASSENVFSADGNTDVNEMPEAGWTLAAGAYTGKAVITSLEANAPDGDKATFSISFEGTGPLAKEAAAGK